MNNSQKNGNGTKVHHKLGFSSPEDWQEPQWMAGLDLRPGDDVRFARSGNSYRVNANGQPELYQSAGMVVKAA